MCQWNFVSAILWKINNGKLENKIYGTWAGEGWEVPTVECPNQCYVKLGDKVLESTSADTEGTEIKLKDIETPPTKKQQWIRENVPGGYFTLKSAENDLYLHGDDSKNKMFVGNVLFIPPPNFKTATEAPGMSLNPWHFWHLQVLEDAA